MTEITDDNENKNGSIEITDAATESSDEKNTFKGESCGKNTGNADTDKRKSSSGTENKSGGKRSDDKSKDEKKGSALKELVSWIEVFVVAIAAALFINTFIIANSTVPSGSMEDTIEQGDRVIGSRLSYTFGSPEKGDVAIFKFGWICNRCGRAQGEGEAPDICPNCGEEITRPKTLYYLKRVIGVPGDRIEIKQDGTVKQSEVRNVEGLDMSKGDDAELITAAVYVNGEKLSEGYLKEPMLYTGDMEFEVPDNCYFMLGDNRNNSLDARYWENPYISKNKMVAKVMFRYFPKPSSIK